MVMAAQAGFRAGRPNRVSWKAGDDSGEDYVELCNFRHSWAESDEGHDVTSSCHEGIQAIIATILRGEGEVSFHIKDDMEPWELGFGAGAYGMLKAEFGFRQPYYIPVYISRVPLQNETAAGCDWTINFKLNREAGEYIVPTNS